MKRSEVQLKLGDKVVIRFFNTADAGDETDTVSEYVGGLPGRGVWRMATGGTYMDNGNMNLGGQFARVIKLNGERVEAD
jgi:hypothetical protein